jgi:hypothetical protein
MRAAIRVPAKPHRASFLAVQTSSWSPSSSPCGSSFGVPNNPTRRRAFPNKAPLMKASDATAKATSVKNTKKTKSASANVSPSVASKLTKTSHEATRADMPVVNVAISRALLPPRRNHLRGELNHGREDLFVNPAHSPDNSGTSNGSTCIKLMQAGL